MARAGALRRTDSSVQITSGRKIGPAGNAIFLTRKSYAFAQDDLRVSSAPEHLLDLRDVHLLVANFLAREFLERDVTSFAELEKCKLVPPQGRSLAYRFSPLSMT
jgi:hypothetical protein